MLSKVDKEYIINEKITKLNIVRSIVLDGADYISDSLEDIDRQIMALTNALEML